MQKKILNLLNENKRQVFFVRIPLEITDNLLPLTLNMQCAKNLECIPRKYILVIKLEGKFYKLEPFKFVEISENIFEFLKSITNYYSDSDSYRFFYDEEEKGIYLDFDDLSGWEKFCSDSRANLKAEIFDKKDE